MPYTNPRHKARQQRQRRRAGYVKRLEVTLSADSDRDVEIYDHLAGLPVGTVAEFVKQAIAEKIARDQGRAPAPQQAPQPAQSEASAQFEALMQELAAQRREIAELREAVAAPVIVAAGDTPQTDRRRRMQPDARSAPPVAATDTSTPGPGEIESSGIDMSRPRRRRSAPGASPAPPPDDQQPPALDARAEAALTRQLLASIQGFGVDR